MSQSDILLKDKKNIHMMEELAQPWCVDNYDNDILWIWSILWISLLSGPSWKIVQIVQLIRLSAVVWLVVILAEKEEDNQWDG